MRTKWTLGCAAAFLLGTSSPAQDWTLAGNTINTAEYFGAGPLSTIPLSFETRVNQPMYWFTNNAMRMRLNGGLPGQVINGYTVDLSGFLGMGLFTSAYPHASARFHTERSSSFTDGYRPDILDGFLATQGERLFYGGLLGSGGDAGIMWARTTGSGGTTGVFKYIYTGFDGSTTTTASSASGLELGRFQPATSLNEGYFGVGDWTSAGLSPTERLDVLNGRARLRTLPDDPAAVSDYLVMVVDKSTSLTERGVVKWVDPASLPSGCDWIVDPTASSVYDICTAYTGSSCSWDNTHNVGIGLIAPKAKLDVLKDYTITGAGSDFGIRVEQTTTEPYNIGVQSTVHGITQVSNIGGRFEAGNCGRAIGVHGIAACDFGNFGVLAEAISTTAQANYGLFARGHNASSVNWAGYFVGDVYSTTGVYAGSDESLKTNIAPLSSALDVISQLAPKTYDFTADAMTQMQMPSGQQTGLIAQDVEAVLPQLVKESLHPAVLDDQGNEVTAATPFKALNYTGFIPYLIGAIQEQQQQIKTLQDQVANCCKLSADVVPLMPVQGGAQGDQRSAIIPASGSDQLRIQPNPMNDAATISYTLATAGQVRLLVSTSEGRQLAVLEELHRDAGSFSFNWNTTALANGVYNVMLLVDGAPVVQRAVKIAR